MKLQIWSGPIWHSTKNWKLEGEDPTLVKLSINIFMSCLNKYPIHHNLIKSMYKLSKSTCSRIWRSKSSDFKIQQDGDEWKSRTFLSLEAKELIKLAIKPPRRPTTVRELIELVHKRLNEETGYQSIRAVLRRDLKLSNK